MLNVGKKSLQSFVVEGSFLGNRHKEECCKEWNYIRVVIFGGIKYHTSLG